MIRIQLAIPNLRVFKRQVGVFKTTAGTHIKIGIKGQADLYALVKTKHGLIHIEIEVKSGAAVQSKEQKHWQNFIESMSGLYIIARTPEQTELEIKNAIGKML